ncbi:hypothetical protein TK45_07500 [Bowmanella sp. JS7-9]|nr:hypothetical protein TK45_07500 [Bowmanella sp. JS7-9]
MKKPESYELRKYGRLPINLIAHLSLSYSFLFDWDYKLFTFFCSLLFILFSELILFNKECRSYMKHLKEVRLEEYRIATEERSVSENIAIYRERQRELRNSKKWWQFWV